MPISRRLVRLLLVLRAARIVLAQPYVTLVNDSSGTWWFSHLGKQFLSFAVNHANNGNPFDDGVGGREREVCRAATGNNLCGDSLNFGGKLGYAPYFNVTQDKYGPDESAWANASIARVLSWGFNGISGWSHTVAESAARSAGAYYYHLLDAGITWPHAGNGLDFDAWSANFSQQIAVIVAREVPPRANDTQLIAWQTDNENGFASVGIATYVKTYAASTGGAVLITWLQTRYNASIASLNSAWGTHANGWTSADIASQLPAPNAAAFNADNDDWIAAVVDRYLNITVTEIRKYDTNHLISGVRFSYNSKQIVAAAAKWCDMIDQHDYADLPGVDWLRQIHEVSGRPVILGEFSFTAADSNLPNTHGARAGNPETTQTRRAAKYVAYAKALVTLPFVVGYGWVVQASKLKFVAGCRRICSRTVIHLQLPLTCMHCRYSLPPGGGISWMNPRPDGGRTAKTGSSRFSVRLYCDISLGVVSESTHVPNLRVHAYRRCISVHTCT